MKKRSYIIFMSVAFLLVMKIQPGIHRAVLPSGAQVEQLVCGQLQNGDSSGWLLNINNRYFKSYKHFVGTEEQYEREENGTQVINHTYNMDLFLSKNLNSKWSVGINIPIVNNTRSSLYEHGGNAAGPAGRHSTHSFGLGDMRFAVYSWIIDPAKHTKWNVQAGLGLKLPTGDYRYQDYFIKNDSVKVLGPVDQSIQLGMAAQESQQR